MKKLIIILFLIASVNSFGQKDSVKHDTTFIPAYDVTDTIKASYLYEHGKNVRKAEGFALLRGFKVQKDGKVQWVQQPQIVGVLDNKKRPVKKVIQILN